VSRTTGHRREIPLALLALWILALVLAARPTPVSPPWKAAGAGVAMLLLPGAAVAFVLRRWVGRGVLVCAAFAVPFSLMVVGATALVYWVLGWSLIELSALHLFASFLCLLAALLLPGDPAASVHRAPWVLAVALAGTLMAVWLGAPTAPVTDGPDHMTTINEILLTGDFFPNQGLLADGELDRTDPRKGLLHAGLALVGGLAGTDVRAVWRVTPVLLAGGFLALLGLLGLRLCGSRRGAALAALAALIFSGGGGLSRLGYGAHAGLLVAWAGCWLLLEDLESPSAMRKLILGALAALAGAVHPLAPGFLLVPAAVLFAWSLFDGGSQARRAGTTLTAALLGAAPVLALRFLETRGPLNPLHGQPMPILELGAEGSILWPPAALRQVGWIGVAGLLALPAAWRVLSPGPWRRFLVVTALVPLLVNFVPGVFDVATDWTSSFPIKLLYTLPWFWIVGALFGSRWRGRGRVLRGILALIMVAALPGALSGQRASRNVSRSPTVEAVLDDLRAIRGRAVVAADPWMSSLIAAETPHFPVAVLNQHGNPMDPRGLERLNDLGGALSPWVPLDRSLEILRAYRVSRVVLAGEPSRPLEVGFQAARDGRLASLRARKFNPAEPLFRSAGGRSGARVLTIDWSKAGTAATEPVCPVVSPPRHGVSVAQEDGAAAGVRLLEIAFPDTARAGEVIPVEFWWRRIDRTAGWPVEVHLRIEAVDGRRRGKIQGSLLRWVGRGVPPRRLRFVLAPFLGAWPSAFWPEGRVVSDSTGLRLPETLVPGSYRVAVRVLERPLFFRASWHDLWAADDRWQGWNLGLIEVRAGHPGGVPGSK